MAPFGANQRPAVLLHEENRVTDRRHGSGHPSQLQTRRNRRTRPCVSASNSRRTSSSEMSADQPYAAATAASRASCASASHWRPDVVEVRQRALLERFRRVLVAGNRPLRIAGNRIANARLGHTGVAASRRARGTAHGRTASPLTPCRHAGDRDARFHPFATRACGQGRSTSA